MPAAPASRGSGDGRAGPGTRMSPPGRAWIVFGAVAAVAATADLVSKRVAFDALGMPGSGRRIEIMPRILSLETNLNEGALFGMGQGFSAGFAAISLVALVGILGLMSRPATRQDPWLVLALGLIVGGIVGNLYDRLGLPGLAWHAPPDRLGEPVRAVRDWIHFQLPGVIDWPIFNLADSWLVAGAGLLLVSTLRRPAEAAAPEA
jgi:signal peptidase II